jgi:hypothetical protein
MGPHAQVWKKVTMAKTSEGSRKEAAQLSQVFKFAGPNFSLCKYQMQIVLARQWVHWGFEIQNEVQLM